MTDAERSAFDALVRWLHKLLADGMLIGAVTGSRGEAGTKAALVAQLGGSRAASRDQPLSPYVTALPERANPPNRRPWGDQELNCW
jgi:hypothetical protein